MAKVQGIIATQVAPGIVTTLEILDGTIATIDLDDDSVTLDKLVNITQGSFIVGGGSNAPTELVGLTDKQMLIGDGTDLVSVVISGDISITNAGVVTLTPGRIDLDDGDGNILIGLTAGDSLTGGSGLRNICIGANAGTALTTGDDNVIHQTVCVNHSTISLRGRFKICKESLSVRYTLEYILALISTRSYRWTYYRFPGRSLYNSFESKRRPIKGRYLALERFCITVGISR